MQRRVGKYVQPCGEGSLKGNGRSPPSGEDLDGGEPERVLLEEERAEEGFEAVGQHAAPRAAGARHGLVVVVPHTVLHAARGRHVADERVVDERSAQHGELPMRRQVSRVL